MKIDVIRLGGLSPINDQEIKISGVNVLFGANGSGKSSLLAAVYAMLSRICYPHLEPRGEVTLQFSGPNSPGVVGQPSEGGTIEPEILNGVFAELNDRMGFFDGNRSRKFYTNDHVETFLTWLASSSTPSRTGLFREDFAGVLGEDSNRYATLLRSLLGNCRFNLTLGKNSDDVWAYTWSLVGLIDPATLDQHFTDEELITIERLKWSQFRRHGFVGFVPTRDNDELFDPDTLEFHVIGVQTPHLLLREDELLEVPLVHSSMVDMSMPGFREFPLGLSEMLPVALVLNNELVVTFQERLNIAVSNIGKLIGEFNRQDDYQPLQFRERYSFNEMEYDDSRKRDTGLPSGVLPWTQGDVPSFASEYLQAARLISSLASALRPGFLLDRSIEVRLAHRKGEQALVYLGDKELHELPEGHRTWVAYCVSLASVALANGLAWIPEEDYEEEDLSDWQKRCILSLDGSNFEPLIDANFNLVVCIDEVESHLYPSYLTLIKQWAEDIADKWGVPTQFIASHDIHFVDSSQSWARLFLDLRNRSMDESDFRTEIRRFKPGQFLYGESEIEFLGLTSAELFMRTRLMLFVEGDRDKVTLETWFPVELRAHGIHVISMDGLNNEASLVPFYEAMLSQLGKPFVVLTDKRKQRSRGDSGGQLDQLHKATSPLRSVDGGGVRALRIEIKYEDGLYLIDDRAYQNFATISPWPGLLETWKRRAKKNVEGEAREWKRSLLPNYGVDVSPDGLVPILKWAKENRLVSEELTGILRDIINFSQ